MFVAQNEAGRLVNLAEETVDNRFSHFCCPGCQQAVRYKQGTVMRTHFAHVSLADCQYFSENESAQHLGLKAALYSWAKRAHPAQIEAVLPAIQQVADILVADKVAFEVRCSRLSLERLRERTLAYQEQGLSVVWLLGKDLWLKDRLTNLHKGFLYFSHNMGFHLWELDLDRRQLRLRYLIHEDLHGKVQCLTKEFAFGKGNLLDTLRQPFQAQRLVSFQGKIDAQLTRYIAQQLYFQQPKWMAIQAELYQEGKNVLTMSVEEFYPQVRLPHSETGFVQIREDLTPVYADFERYYQAQSDRSQQILYPPAYYGRFHSSKNAV